VELWLQVVLVQWQLFQRAVLHFLQVASLCNSSRHFHPGQRGSTSPGGPAEGLDYCNTLAMPPFGCIGKLLGLRISRETPSCTALYWLTPVILDQEDYGSRPAQANSSWDPTCKITKTKWTKGVAQVVGHLLYKRETLSSNPSQIKKEKRKNSLIHEPRISPSFLCLLLSLSLMFCSFQCVTSMVKFIPKYCILFFTLF
jgi:hypothetical protein